MDNPIMKAVVSFLEAESWAHRIDEGGAIARMRFRGASGEWKVIVQLAGADQALVAVHSLPEAPIPVGRRVDAAETVCRLNNGLILGNFELDMDSGAVRFKTSADFREHAPTKKQLGSLIFTNMAMVDRYLPAIHAVVFGGRSPAEAVAEADRGKDG